MTSATLMAGQAAWLRIGTPRGGQTRVTAMLRNLRGKQAKRSAPVAVPSSPPQQAELAAVPGAVFLSVPTGPHEFTVRVGRG